MYASNKLYPIVSCDIRPVRLPTVRSSPGLYSVAPTIGVNRATFHQTAVIPVGSQSPQPVSSKRYYSENCSEASSSIQLCHHQNHLQQLRQCHRCPALQPNVSQPTSLTKGLKQIADNSGFTSKSKMHDSSVTDMSNDNLLHQSSRHQPLSNDNLLHQSSRHQPLSSMYQ